MINAKVGGLVACPKCGAPCNRTVNMRGGDYGWSTSDEERAVYKYALSAHGLPVVDEPTQNMIQAGYEAMKTNNSRDSSEQGRVRRIYLAMREIAVEATP